MNEIWLPIAGYDKYSVSSIGRIKNNKSGRILRFHESKEGYLKVSLFDKKPKTFLVHRLVGIVFIPNPDNLPQINHISGIKTDNRVENLEWCTNSYNELHAFSIGLKTITENNRKAVRKRHKDSIKKIVLQYDLNEVFLKEWESCRAVEESLGFYRSNISLCASGKGKSSNGFIWKYKTSSTNTIIPKEILYEKDESI